MQLSSFSISNYRSIIGTHKIPLGDFSVLIGKNNEGKSNILRALAVCMQALSNHASPTSFRKDTQQYLWKRDFPISLQERKNSLDSVFRLEFSLDEKEVAQFRQKIKSNLNGDLPIEIRFSRGKDPKIHVPKRGPGGNALSEKSKLVAAYIATRIEFNYIPAIRTENEAEGVVQEMLALELSKLETNEDYIQALTVISNLQQPVLDKIAGSIKASLTDFLPNIRNVYVKVPSSARRLALRSQCQVEIDDGSRTLLEFKGDGVKSLAALGLLKDKKRAEGVASIIAIEEPESHLHPGAIHSLRDVVMNLTSQNQVVLTTHCPLFADRENLSRNILIDSSTAKQAKNIAEIRNLLGIQASDNLVNANFVLVVEGEEDVIALRAILPTMSDVIKNALKSHQLVIEQLGGASNLSYKLSLLANALCSTHVLLDNDDAGKGAFEKAAESNMLKMADITMVNCRGMKQSEMEDCFDIPIYKDQILIEYGVDLATIEFRGNEKWSDRVKACFTKEGKPWGDRIKSRVKLTVARAVAESPDLALNVHKSAPIEALVKALENKLKK